MLAKMKVASTHKSNMWCIKPMNNTVELKHWDDQHSKTQSMYALWCGHTHKTCSNCIGLSEPKMFAAKNAVSTHKSSKWAKMFSL